jgi:uncharacterized integral membrane protein
MANEYEGTPREPARSTTEQLKLIGAVVAGIILIVFFLQNLQQVTINFLWFDIETDMIWALISSAILGGLSVFLLMWFGRRRERDRLR